MLTKRQNLMETITGGNPDRFVNQYEFLVSQPTFYGMVMGDPVSAAGGRGGPGSTWVNSWGVTYSWPEGVPGGFPVHGDKIVVKDITKWQDVVKAPNLDYPQEEWDEWAAKIVPVDRNELFLAVMVAPGIFEQLHHLQGMDNALLNFYEEPDATKELIAYLTDYEVKYAKLLCDNFHPDALFHHDDWGSFRSSFLAPDMHEEFIAPAYEKIYGTYKANGVELIVHHSDSYAANLVPIMIDVGIDIFQGASSTNNVPELIKKYGGKISFMGDIDNGVVDKADWTKELVEHEVRRACESNGKHYFIPCVTMGGPETTYPGVYEAVSEAIDKMSQEMF